MRTVRNMLTLLAVAVAAVLGWQTLTTTTTRAAPAQLPLQVEEQNLDLAGRIQVSLPNVDENGRLLVAPPQTTQVAGTVNVDQNSSDREPYQHLESLFQTECAQEGIDCHISFPFVPNGKRLVITYASVRFQHSSTSSGDGARAMLSLSGLCPCDEDIHLPAPVDTGNGILLAAGPVSFYAHSGSSPTIIFETEFLASSFEAEASIVGYLVPE